MAKRLITWLAGIVMAQSAFALSQCPAEVKGCGPNPFYILVTGFSQVCSERISANAPKYKAALAAMIAENPEPYARMDTDAEFQEKLQMLRQEAAKMPLVELRSECAKLLPNNTKSTTMTK